MVEKLPLINACLNATAAFCLLMGFIAIKSGKRETHMKWMLGAVAASAVFLVSYLTRTYLTGTHRFPDVGWPKTVYLSVLFSHMILAIAVVPMVLRLLFLAAKKRFDDHRRLARWTWPIWIYVSITGVLIYWMLYHWAETLIAV